MEDTAYRFQYRSYHMSHNHWNSKISKDFLVVVSLMVVVDMKKLLVKG